jgi:hypothetical protein
MSTVCGPSWFGPASRDFRSARSRGPHRVTVEPSTLQQRSTDAAIERARVARWDDVESGARNGDSQHSGGPLSTVRAGLLATRLDSDPSIHAVAPFAQVTAGEALPTLTPNEPVGDWGASRVGVGSPARGERPPHAGLRRHRRLRAGAPGGGRSTLAGVSTRSSRRDICCAPTCAPTPSVTCSCRRLNQ